MPYIDVVEDVCRFTYLMHWAPTGRKIANVVDMQIDTTGGITDRADAIADQAAVLSANWTTLYDQMSDNVVLDGVRWIDLDQADGSTGLNIDDQGATGAETGTNDAPPNLAVIVQKRTTSGRGSRSGRMYLAGVLEALVNESGIITPSAIQTHVNTWKAAVEQETGGDPNYSSKLVVVHLGPHPDPIPGPSTEVVGTYSVVSDLAVESLCGTQRRRMRA